MVRHEVEPAIEIDLEPVDSVVVTTLIDNVTDALMTDQGPARRFAFGSGPSRPSALMEAAQVPDALTGSPTRSCSTTRRSSSASGTRAWW